ncbi:hypothetical protein BDY21DRAFT_367708 [Lineolata rhizophorae]|uniref:Uncharacterized protein n=1 Tax=Lineolata rhizophorae TaxID=578093 RepID=A0A6A6NLF3_9PEZI|nr:hypothetical protein BDY21DRAFT_367708 [Lineolata rhizophorae]
MAPSPDDAPPTTTMGLKRCIHIHTSTLGSAHRVLAPLAVLVGTALVDLAAHVAMYAMRAPVGDKFIAVGSFEGDGPFVGTTMGFLPEGLVVGGGEHWAGEVTVTRYHSYGSPYACLLADHIVADTDDRPDHLVELPGAVCSDSTATRALGTVLTALAVGVEMLGGVVSSPKEKEEGLGA